MATKIRHAIIGLSTLVAGCAANQPGQGVSPAFADAWGCDAAEVEQLAQAFKESLPPGHVYIPRPGWDACELMARVGRPKNFDTVSYSQTREARWWYPKGEYGTRLVSLRLQDRGWVVRYVDW